MLDHNFFRVSLLVCYGCEVNSSISFNIFFAAKGKFDQEVTTLLGAGGPAFRDVILEVALKQLVSGKKAFTLIEQNDENISTHQT